MKDETKEFIYAFILAENEFENGLKKFFDYNDLADFVYDSLKDDYYIDYEIIVETIVDHLVEIKNMM